MGEGRILVVDDEPQIRHVMRATLAIEGYEVADARSGHDALERLHSEKYDLVLLDINMPGITLSTSRPASTASRVLGATPTAMITVRAGSSAPDEATGAVPEMLARIRAALRRSAPSPSPWIGNVRIGDMEIDFRARRLTSQGRQIRLSSKEFDLLSYLAAHSNRVIPHEELLRAVSGPEYGEQREYLRVFINRLRKKIEPLPQDPQYLIKEPWIGYSLKLPER